VTGLIDDEAATAMARKAIGPLAEKAKGDPRRLAAVSSMALAAGDSARAYALACEARRLTPGDAYVRAATQAALVAGVPAWHFGIVRDEARNAAWNAAIEKAVTPDSTVLDVGAGTGILAMMAARAGARRVVSCEMSPAVAEAATRIVEANGYSDRIAIVPAHSRDLTPERMDGKADVFVSEIVSNNLVGQDAADTVRDAMRRLVKPGGKVIPATTTARIALAWWQQGAEKRLKRIDGFDLTAFNPLEPFPHQVKRGDPGLQLRSEPADLFRFDFQNVRFPDPLARVELEADGGEINGIVQWIRIGLDESVEYENRPEPGGPRSCWACLFHPFEGAIAPPAGTPVAIGGEYTRNELRIWLAEADPADARST
jgi:type II protein arginine methyltransferase